jgi:hypothetical protein
MRSYYQKANVKAVTVNDAGLMDVTFRDTSRYVGQGTGEGVEGRGTLYIQDLGKIEGKFFGNKVVEGTFFFASALFWEGTFDEDERWATGVLELTQTGDRIALTCVGGRVTKLQLLPDGKLVTFDVTRPATLERVLESGLVCGISADGHTLTFRRIYNEGLLEGDALTVDLSARTFILQHYEFNRQKGVQKELYLSDTPYTRVFQLDPEEPRRQTFRVTTAAGCVFDSDTGWARGVLKEPGKEYVYHGGIQGNQRTGQATLAFVEDSCELGVTYVQDKLAFDNLESIFEFVKGFDCVRHPRLRFSESTSKVKFIEAIESFEGAVNRGTSAAPITMTLTNGLTYKGRLKDWKMDGRGTMTSDRWEATGEFIRGELRFGVVTYRSGVKYEGQLLDFKRNDSGRMYWVNDYSFQGNFRDDRVTRKDFGMLRLPSGKENKYLGVDLEDFELCVFVPQKETDPMFVWSYVTDKMHDATFLDKLESSGFNVRESLRNIGIN